MTILTTPSKVWAVESFDPDQYQGRANVLGLYASEAGAERARVTYVAEYGGRDEVFVQEYEVEA